jgi:hypothetical protein
MVSSSGRVLCAARRANPGGRAARSRCSSGCAAEIPHRLGGHAHLRPRPRSRRSALLCKPHNPVAAACARSAPESKQQTPYAEPPFLSTPQALARMFQPLASWAQRRYQASLAEHLKDYGLRYDDLYDPLMDMVRPLMRARMGGAGGWGRRRGRMGGPRDVQLYVLAAAPGAFWGRRAAAASLTHTLLYPQPLTPPHSIHLHPSPPPQRTSPRRCGGCLRTSSSRATSASSARWT